MVDQLSKLLNWSISSGFREYEFNREMGNKSWNLGIGMLKNKNREVESAQSTSK